MEDTWVPLTRLWDLLVLQLIRTEITKYWKIIFHSNDKHIVALENGKAKGTSKKYFTLFGEKMLSLGADLPKDSEHSMGMLSL